MDQNLEQEQGQKEENQYQKYIDKINELKSNSVDKSKFDELKDENKRLLDAMMNQQEAPKKSTDTTDYLSEAKKLAAKLHDDDVELNNLEFCRTAVDFRQAMIKSDLGDPFVKISDDANENENSKLWADRVEDVIRQCIDNCDGSSRVFTSLLSERTNDLPGLRQILNSKRR